MFVDFQFWRYLTHREHLLSGLENADAVRGFKKRVGILLGLTVLFYILIELWGMTTSSLTSLYVLGYLNTYAIARWVSLVGIIFWALLYFAFQLFGVSQLLHILTRVPLRVAAIMQLYVIAVLLIEKTLIFVIYALVGYTTPFSFLSFGPLAANFLEWEFFHYFFNQFSVFTGLVIAIQLQFLQRFTDFSTKVLLAILVGMHIVFAAIIALVSIFPWENVLLGGGLG